MANCELIIYKTDLIPDKNALIEDIDEFLENSDFSRRVYTEQNFQYQKFEVNMSIKVRMNQATVSRDNTGNYCRFIDNSADRVYYYFITDARPVSENAVEFALALDSVNTFPELLGSLSEATNVVREHRSRFHAPTKLQRESLDRLRFEVDKIPEGVSNLPKEMLNSESISDTLTYSANWHLVYMSPDKPTSETPIECYLMPDRTDVPYAGGTGGEVTKKCNPQQIGGRNDFQFAPYYFGQETNQYGSLRFRNGYGQTYQNITLGAQYETAGIVEGVIFDTYKDEYSQPVSLKIMVVARSGDAVKIVEATLGIPTVSEVIFEIASNWIRTDGVVEQLNAGSTINYLESYSHLDLTDAKILKTIDCPYCPIRLSWSGNSLNRPSGATIKNNRILIDPTMEFGRDAFNSFMLNDMQTQAFIFQDMEHMARFIKDPKLLHSDFTTHSMNYDSFASEIKYENIEQTSNWNLPQISLDYKQSSKMASDLGFRWYTQYGAYKNTEPYDQYLLSTRNNEDIIFTNAYLEYLKNGINFYRSQRATESVSRWVGATASVAGAVLSAFKGGLISGAGGPLGAIAGISLAATAVATTANAITGEIQASNAEAEKRYNLKLQGASIEGATDLALFKWYSGNKLKFNTSKLPESLEEKFDDLFYYCGYATNVQKVPNTYTRYWFNFLQCEPDFDFGVYPDGYYTKWLADFSNRLANGITVYHRHDNHWDFKQELENWEVELV